ncbi:alpha-N-arabinofuranosidase [Nonomuraea thailandensis]|uniref:non-reducing end alpha-L-arabinofuranosidase n=1 Tax=Nonomuraea thailandensis TaxID=1188745 RepID=A0A9X2GG72_9ACTN|nr:alpha-N-arabinofuranosidase [Nonomuraea thailandensis]MCP2353503.1 alpha-N-arabinofuranosidase [Nonomuraea thailandensis]
MSNRARLALDPAFRIAPVEPRLFGSFVEHMGRCVYTGIFEPGHPHADADGFRTDVLDLVRELGVTLVRYPGGNFVSNYRWEDGVGPRDQRPTTLDLAWRSIEDNSFGLNEFMAWAAKAGVEPMMALNLGTRGVAEALQLVEYANHPGGTRMSELRRAHGADKPHDIRLWCLGNELDGPWQMGHKTAREYGRLAAETARALNRLDPGLALVACGSSNSSIPTFGAWEAEVLEETYELVDYISLHAYYDPGDGDADSFLASAADMEHMIRSIAATADHTAAKLRSRKRLKLSFDEWNVWYQSRFPGESGLEWARHPRLIEDSYDLTDAVVVGSLLITLLRNADRVGVACQAQLANVIAPIMTEPGGPAWRQTIFHPFALTARHARGQVLRVEPDCSTVRTAKHGEVPVVCATATHDPASGEIALFVVNRDRHRPCVLEVALPRGLVPVEHVELADADPCARNTSAEPERVVPRPGSGLSCQDGAAALTLPPTSWTLVRFASEE